MSLKPIVELFRTAHRPLVQNGVFSASLDLTDNISSLISSIANQTLAQFDEVLIDGSEITSGKIAATKGTCVEFVLRLPTGSACRFYESFSDLLKGAPQIARGELPTSFYIIEDDYFFNIDPQPLLMKKLSVVCRLIKELSVLAHYHDEKAGSGHFRLVFLQPENSSRFSPNVLELETSIDIGMLEGDIPDISLVESLQIEHVKTDPHYSSRIGVFGVSLVEFLKKHPTEQSAFSFLILNWAEFVNTYNQNLGTYLSGFAFHKAKREVAEAEFKIAEQFSRIISDITGKLLGIPLSLIATIAIVKSTSTSEGFLLVFGLSIATLIISGTVGNQQRQLQRIIHAKNVVFDAIEGKKESYPDALRDRIDEMVSELSKNENKLRWLLRLFRVLSWIPFLVGLFFFYLSYLTVL